MHTIKQEITWDSVKAKSNRLKHRIAFSDIEDTDSNANMKKEYDFSPGKRGSIVKTRGKTRITIHLDDEVIAAFRVKAEEVGCGYQTLINDALRQHLSSTGKPVDSKTLRRILREELKNT